MLATSPQLVSIGDFGLLGSNFYWHQYSSHGLSQQDILQAGLTDDTVYVDRQIIPALLAADQSLQQINKRLYIKEGYRDKKVYQIVYRRRVEQYGQSEADQLFNMLDMPHALGLSVDATLLDRVTGKEIFLRSAADGLPALFINFYRQDGRTACQQYQQLQDLLIGLMLENGFRIGKKQEYFHFDYRPDMPFNYPQSI